MSWEEDENIFEDGQACVRVFFLQYNRREASRTGYMTPTHPDTYMMKQVQELMFRRD